MYYAHNKYIMVYYSAVAQENMFGLSVLLNFPFTPFPAITRVIKSTLRIHTDIRTDIITKKELI